MKLGNIIKHLIVNFRTKYKLSFQDVHQKDELWSFFISPLRILFSGLALFCFIAIITMGVIIYTPVLDLLPGYPGNKSREILLKNVVRLDSLDQAIKQLNLYESNITAIMNGKSPVSVTASKSLDTLKKSSDIDTNQTNIDSVFRATIETDVEAAQRAKDNRIVRNSRSFGLFTPIQGVVSRPFDISTGKFGIEVSSTTDNQEVLAVNDGVVIFSVWSPESGNIIQVQHSGNMISIYTLLSRKLKNVGDRVKAGEVIGYVGAPAPTDEDVSAGAILGFELWDTGVAVDPINYILF